MRVAVVDYGMGNLHSVSKAVEHVAPHARVEVTSDPVRVAGADLVVFPGQGVLDAARSRPFLGICIGLQMLFERSDEGDVAGLALFPGTVRCFPAEAMVDHEGNKLKVPHIGWNRVKQSASHALWSGIEDGTRFYFVHSYFPQTGDSALIRGTTDYGLSFTCTVARDNVFAVQFHPEKSDIAGLRLLANFLNWNP
jgi:glutamine amidotransferase